MERFILQPANRKEAEKAMALIDEAKEFLKSQGIDQWQTGYPDMETIIGDLEHGRGYFIEEGSNAAAYLCIDFAGEASYETLQGSWKSDLPYAVVHRMAISGAYRGHGIASIAFQLIEELRSAPRTAFPPYRARAWRSSCGRVLWPWLSRVHASG